MKMQNYCIRIQEDTLNQVTEIAMKKKRKISEMIRIIIEDYVEKINL